jgi:transcriptional regulator with XRE-family HTH domain
MKMNFTREELADYFEVSRKTLYNKLHKANKRGLLTLEQIYLICDHLGYPKPTLERSKLQLPPLKR